MEAIRCEGLTKRYGEVVALTGLDLSVPEGSVFGFLGPNGAGKTTTLRLLAGLGAPTAGRAWVAGEEVSSANVALRQRIGYLPEEPAFPGWMTGRECVALAGELFGASPGEARRRGGELLELVGLAAAAGRKVSGYSRGMRQRLGIAQALVNNPSVLLLDEPSSALDPRGRREVLDLIASLREEATIFLSTHILSDVERVCDQAAIIVGGRLLVQGSLEELRRRVHPGSFRIRVAEGEERRGWPPSWSLSRGCGPWPRRRCPRVRPRPSG